MTATRRSIFVTGWKHCGSKLIDDGTEVPRPEPGDGTASENVTDWIIKINELAGRLTAGVPDDPEERNEEQQARWILANILDWHRRELKAVWWEYFRLSDLSADELLDERAGLSGLELRRAGWRKAEDPDSPIQLSAAGDRASWRRRTQEHWRRQLRHA